MEQISRQLLYQRLRNRTIEVFEAFASLEYIAEIGAFEAINSAFDWLPIDYDEAPGVFSKQEKIAIAKFIQLVETASETIGEDTGKIAWFNSSMEWMQLSAFSNDALQIFLKRGRFSEDGEEPHLD
ncbi:MAG: hypothetical protein AB3N11_13665 [Arenibacterium sp.]